MRTVASPSTLSPRDFVLAPRSTHVLPLAPTTLHCPPAPWEGTSRAARARVHLAAPRVGAPPVGAAGLRCWRYWWLLSKMTRPPPAAEPEAREFVAGTPVSDMWARLGVGPGHGAEQGPGAQGPRSPGELGGRGPPVLTSGSRTGCTPLRKGQSGLGCRQGSPSRPARGQALQEPQESERRPQTPVTGDSGSSSRTHSASPPSLRLLGPDWTRSGWGEARLPARPQGTPLAEGGTHTRL